MAPDISQDKEMSRDIRVIPANGENASDGHGPRISQPPASDTLSHCLLHIARHHGRPISRRPCWREFHWLMTGV